MQHRRSVARLRVTGVARRIEPRQLRSVLNALLVAQRLTNFRAILCCVISSQQNLKRTGLRNRSVAGSFWNFLMTNRYESHTKRSIGPFLCRHGPPASENSSVTCVALRACDALTQQPDAVVVRDRSSMPSRSIKAPPKSKLAQSPDILDGDLISGIRSSQIATLAEHESRFALLACVDGKDTESVVTVLALSATAQPAAAARAPIPPTPDRSPAHRRPARRASLAAAALDVRRA